MKKSFVLLLLIFIAFNTASAGDTIFYKLTRALSWSDFKGKAGNSPTGTGSYIGVDYDLQNDDNGFRTTVKAYFLPDLSWAKFKNDTLLEHEQLRFDMAELYARKLRKAFSEYKFNKATVVQDIKKIFRTLADERAQMNEQYNKETKFATNYSAQKAWSLKISEDLDRLGKFAEE